VGIANQITILRIFLIPIFVIFLGYNKPLYALITFLIAGITDALDGFIARKLNQVTTLGKVLDPIADKALLISAFVFISLVIYLLKGNLEVRPSIYGKLTTFFQILSVLIIFEIVYTVIYIATVFTVLSALTYTYEGLRQLTG